ncbi:hypothetical protein AOL_s00043g199 [Orbilia oligospora ATCC 24927]|uniref:F-box domain-containing protein n=2 Tax=Orbilia oligospora TaxID=2813651 RepID=G1X3C6_ARTOA|nr:hypothetical protein AOL_s00043g199 [Orbilia oligospora ATCC 24927]EGX52410.1 hypothetical protein AOL_s00043g199 [Orbilia oligospora ATCC 24927]KAF3289284.1 hypothetical protein TWF970_003064 [Orbilia oligospora]
MASLIALTRVPEILLDILSYLSNNDVVSLQSTCKALSPVCHKRLWSVLIFQLNGDPWYPNHGIDSLKVRYHKLTELLKYRGADTSGFFHTKVIWFGSALFESRHFIRAEGLRSLLRDVLNKNKVDLQCAIVSFPSHRFDVNNTPEKFEILDDLKRYSRARPSNQKFEIKVQAETVNSLSKYFCLDLITEFVFRVNYKPYETRNYSWTVAFGSVDENVTEFAAVLNMMPNLKTFTWISNKHVGKAPVPSEKSSEDLQKAFGGLKHLKKMEVDGYIFHPSLFLVPPESVKSLKFCGNIKSSWWENFASSPLNITSLTFDALAAHCLSYRDIEELLEYRVKEVGVRGLKTLWLSGHLPSGLRACILEKNPEVISRKFSGKYAYDIEGERTEFRVYMW